ncbi:hypothetical protein SprV_0301385700 [Sparganum proliferum]
MVSEASSGDWKPCGDYLAINSAAIPDRCPVPHLQDFAGALFGEAVFSKIDLVRAFRQIPVAPEDMPKTAVTTPFLLFGFIRIPFGLRNAAQTFQRPLDHFLHGLLFVYSYIDDLFVASQKKEEHKEHLAMGFDRLDKFDVVINPSKCVLGVPSLELFGHQVDSEGRDFIVFTDHKLLTFALRSHSDKYNPREIAHLDYISRFTTDIRHIDGAKNEVADMRSRPSLSSLQLSHGIDLCAMVVEQQRVGCPGDESVSGLRLKYVTLTTGSGTILCDVSTPFHRPFVPASMRRAVFRTLHGLSHPEIQASQKLLAGRCNATTSHTRHFHQPRRMVQPCVVGPLPPSNGFTHLLTFVDQYTCWAEAISLPNAQTETIVKAYVSRWVAMFGAPSTVTTDRGAQFESALFQTLLNFLGCTCLRTTAYSPAANCMVERFHRQLKTFLRALEDPGNWSDNLSLSRFNIGAALKSDLGCSVAELVFS